MSDLLWRCFWDDDVERFRRLLAPSWSCNSAHDTPSSSGLGTGTSSGNPVLGGSPRAQQGPKTWRRASGFGNVPPGGRGPGSIPPISRGDINSRDHAGLTLLLRAASSNLESAAAFVQALVDHPALDLHVQDPESGWNALHRALYAGNISIARILLDKERMEFLGYKEASSSGMSRIRPLIKTKDHEGHSPFDVYNEILKNHIFHTTTDSGSLASSDSGETASDWDETIYPRLHSAPVTAEAGEDFFVFGSNRNRSLGTGDDDDRQFPERIQLSRPGRLLLQSYKGHEQQKTTTLEPNVDEELSKLPFLFRAQPLHVEQVIMAKFHSAVLTTDPISNLYVAGIGRGGRLGLGDEDTQFRFVPVRGPLSNKKVMQVALGQNHTMAVVDTGELWTWGMNADAQLGYSLPPPPRCEEDPFTAVPRQVFGPLKKEIIRGIAASGHHSVAHTGTVLYCWGRNAGQLGLVDSDARALHLQSTPRKVSTAMFLAPISMVSAIERATTCLLENHQVCVFTNYGYTFVKFGEALNQAQLSYFTRCDLNRNKAKFIISGGETIAAVTKGGDLCAVTLRGRNAPGAVSAGSTTNPGKVRNAITNPQHVWASKKEGVRSASVGEDGSIIISTDSGAVWKRIKRPNSKSASFGSGLPAKAKDFKFQRVPNITNVVHVSSSTFGAFAAVRRDSNIMKSQVNAAPRTLWHDIAKLHPLSGYTTTVAKSPSGGEQEKRLGKGLAQLSREVATTLEVRHSVQRHIEQAQLPANQKFAYLCTSSEPDIRLPVHPWVIGARSPVLRTALATTKPLEQGPDNDLFRVEQPPSLSGLLVVFLDIDFLTLLNLVVYAYTDATLPIWEDVRPAARLGPRRKHIRVETANLATSLAMPGLAAAARKVMSPSRSLDQDLLSALDDAAFSDSADLVVQLEDGEAYLHSALACQRCPFFDGLFHGRSGGLWISHRFSDKHPVNVDLSHVRVQAFAFARRFIYVDEGPEMFDRVITDDLGDFVDIVMEVLSVANELMLDRLSQICQHVLARFVNVRNVAHLLNEVSPCAVTTFKRAALDYICAQGEMMLENHLLDELDSDLLHDLDHRVRENQLNCFPITRSGRAEYRLHELYPDLAIDIADERRRRIRNMAFRSQQKELERKLASSSRSPVGSLNAGDPITPVASTAPGSDRTLAGWAKGPQPREHTSPDLRPKSSRGDGIFAMDEDESPSPVAQSSGPLAVRELASASTTSGKNLESSLPSDGSTQRHASRYISEHIPRHENPWMPAALPLSKVGLRDIMSEASAHSVEAGAQRTGEIASKQPPPKPSQRERKRQQLLQAQQLADAQADASKGAWNSGQRRKAAWSAPPANSAGDFGAGSHPVASSAASRPVEALACNSSAPAASSSPPSTAKPSCSRIGSSDTRFPGQRPASAQPKPNSGNTPPLAPYSKQYIQRPQRQELQPGLSTMSDIIIQQTTEKEVIHAAATAKHSLDDIQQEQQFLEWWEQEEKRTMEREALRVARELRGREKTQGPGRRRGPADREKKQKQGSGRPSRVPDPSAPPAEMSPKNSTGKEQEHSISHPVGHDNRHTRRTASGAGSRDVISRSPRHRKAARASEASPVGAESQQAD